MTIRNWITLIEAAHPYGPLCLPMWAVDDEVLDRIEGLCMSMYQDNPEMSEDTEKVIADVQRIRSMIRRLTGRRPPPSETPVFKVGDHALYRPTSRSEMRFGPDGKPSEDKLSGLGKPVPCTITSIESEAGHVAYGCRLANGDERWGYAEQFSPIRKDAG